jgi:hypothetical protein
LNQQFCLCRSAIAATLVSRQIGMQLHDNDTQLDNNDAS